MWTCVPFVRREKENGEMEVGGVWRVWVCEGKEETEGEEKSRY